MNTADGRGPVDRTVGPVAWAWSEGDCRGGSASGVQLTDPGKPSAFGSVTPLYPEGHVMELRAELDRLRAERDALREALAGVVNVLELLRTYGEAKYEYASSRAGTLVHVAPTIDAARALLTPNAQGKPTAANEPNEG